MKRHIKALTILCLLSAFVLTGCGTGGNSGSTGEGEIPSSSSSSAADTVVVTAVKNSVDIKIEDLSGYDFTSLFTISVGGRETAVEASYIDSSSVKAEVGKYTVTCSYKGVSAEAEVNVVETVYGLELSKEEISVKISLADTYDYKSLFTASVDGERAEISDDMVSSTVCAEIGTYAYTVTFHGASKTLKVNVVEDCKIEIFATYRGLEIPIGAAADFDCTQLFSLYVDGIAVRVTDAMIDRSALSTPVAGETYEIILRYAKDSASAERKTTVKVVEEIETIVTPKHVVTYPNGEYIDLAALFEITEGGKTVPVTNDMVSGAIDYSSVGLNEITLEYGGKTYTATVEVKRGVIVDYAQTDTIVIRKGTDLDTYSFVKDFRVLVNGIPFKDIPAGYVQLNGADFSAAGEYEVTLRLPYNDNKLGITGNVNFRYAEKTITYVVVENSYSIAVKEEKVVLPKGTTRYNVNDNLTVTINGINQGLTDHKEWVNAITCYAETLSDPLDFNAIGAQEVRVAVYVNGVDAPPVIAAYTVVMSSEIVVTAKDTAVFCGTTLYTKDLFEIFDGEEEIEVTYDMISGKADTFTPGVYAVTIDYAGIEKSATVVVFDNEIKGRYRTGLTTIPPPVSTDEDEDETAPRPVYPIGDLIVSDDGTIVVNKTETTILGGIDEHTMLVNVGGYDYTLYYDNGIVVLNPDNSLRMAFNDYKRPLLYFDEAKWTIEDNVTINYSSSHVLELTFLAYSIDTFLVKSAADGSTMWYGLMVDLVEKSSSDTEYVVSWGEAQYAENFEPRKGAVSSLTYADTDYYFTMLSSSVGKVSKDPTEKKYANLTFKGTFGGEKAELIADSYEGFKLKAGSQIVFSVGSYEIENMKNGGVNYDTNTLFVYALETEGIYAYRFILDPEALTFTYVERDRYFGKYIADGAYVFLDGYGTGYINHNASSYVKTQLSYAVKGSEIEIRYLNTKPSFAYGSGAVFYIDPLLNVLTAKNIEPAALKGVRFENSAITDGAIVHIGAYTVGADASLAKKQFLESIEIVTKDGVLGADDKAKCVDTKCVAFAKPGFYQFTVTVNVGGVPVVSYYALQVLEAVYAQSPIVAAYGPGLVNASNSLSIDGYGRVTLDCGGTRYLGLVSVNEDNSFFFRAYSAANAYVEATGVYIAPGIVRVNCRGAAVFSDYFTTGTRRVTGTDGCVLREISVGGQKTYIYSTSTASTGDVATVETQNDIDPSNVGAIVKITAADGKVRYAKINDWNDAKEGLELIENYEKTER